MGRNLDALLGGAARERSKKSPDGHTTAAGRQVDDSLPAAPESASNAPASVAATPVGATRAGRNEAANESGAVRSSLNADRDADKTAGDAAAFAASANLVPASADPTVATADRLRMIGVDQIRRGSYQPRRLFDAELLQELADSIRAEGMIQPIIVRPVAGAFELVAGERRWRAAQLAGMAELPAIVRTMADQSVAAVSLIENIQRKDLNPLEEAAAFARLCDEFGMTHKEVAESVGRSRASISNLMRLLELHDDVKAMVDKGQLEMGHARAILGAPRDRQLELAKEAIKRALTVRAVEKLVRVLAQPGENVAERKSGPVSDPDINRLSQKLGETLGAAVRIQHKPTGSGKLEISYASVAELQGILAHIK
jgi:ParB family chromosome partitioning protein